VPDNPKIVCDVAIVGGGSAGIGAAVGAAEHGARVVLIERSGVLGGAATLSNVHTLCGLYHPDMGRPATYVNGGFAARFAEAIADRDGQTQPVTAGRVRYLPHHPQTFATVAKQLVQEAGDIVTLFESDCVAIDEDRDQSRWQVSVSDHAGSHQIDAAAVVDSSGNAVVARLLGREQDSAITPAERLQRPAYVFSIGEVSNEFRLDDPTRLQMAATIAGAVGRGQLRREMLGAAFRPSVNLGEVFVTIDLEAGQNEWQPDDPDCRKAIETLGRKLAIELVQFLREALPQAFSGCASPSLPLHAGIRESWHWVGRATLEESDILSSRRSPEDVALGSWPIELREDARGPKLGFPDQPEPYGIPLGCLTAKTRDGLYFAGRCASASHRAMASLRVMGTGLATGQAAGIAAAISAEGADPFASKSLTMIQRRVIGVH